MTIDITPPDDDRIRLLDLSSGQVIDGGPAAERPIPVDEDGDELEDAIVRQMDQLGSD